MNVMREAGLAVSIDAAGNIVGRMSGSVATLKPLVFGSHIDSVPDGGNYDGDVGSLSAIEVPRRWRRTPLVTRHPLEVVIFQNEEGGTVGSRALVGELTADDLPLKTHSGKTIGDGVTFLADLYTRYFSLTDLGIGRLLNLAVALPLGYMLLSRCWTIAGPFQTMFVTLGQRSLGAFVLHV